MSKRDVFRQARDAAEDPEVIAMLVVSVKKDGSSRFSVSPMPDEMARVGLAIGLLGAGGLVSGAKLDPPKSKLS
jgi:hypothetical protein